TKPKLVFDPYSQEYFDDPYEIYRRMRDETPIYYDEEQDFYALTRHADVAAAFKDHATFSSTRGLDLATVRSNTPQVKSIIFMDPPDHRHMRSLVNKVFTPRAIEAQRALVTEQIDRLLAAADPERFDVVQDFAAVFPMEVITRMAGVPEQSAQEVRRWMDETWHREAGVAEMSEAAMQAFMKIGMFYLNLVQERRAEPKDDMTTRLIEAEIPRGNGETSRLDDLEIAGFVTLLNGAGTETVTKLIGTAAVVFAEHPDQWQKLLEDRNKVPMAVEELLRYQGPTQYLVRYSLQPKTLHGITIPAGKPVFLIGASANRDPDAWTSPDTFDIERDLTEAQNLGFGYGVHSCLGAALARLETTMALNRLLDYMPRYDVDWNGCRRFNEPNLKGWSHVPVRVLR
ncbi:cytochrome P450, partial [Mycobacterium sp.]|uniref:cytochrome P450 n=1 Tax=Mycobacterium sp. TaxID=1785 RepID=UPI002DA8E785|nr:cytochrome P450 [Mycobacterium sp.]